MGNRGSQPFDGRVAIAMDKADGCERRGRASLRESRTVARHSVCSHSTGVWVCAKGAKIKLATKWAAQKCTTGNLDAGCITRMGMPDGETSLLHDLIEYATPPQQPANRRDPSRLR